MPRLQHNPTRLHADHVTEQARMIVAGNQTHNEKLATLSIISANFLTPTAMDSQPSGSMAAAPSQQKEFLALFRELLQRIMP